MNCPDCGGKSRVTHTYNHGTVIVRRRRCLSCGAVFSSTENLDRRSEPVAPPKPQPVHA